MKTSNNTILITGGCTGIGYELTKYFSSRGNHVIIVGSERSKLSAAASWRTNITALLCDLDTEEGITYLVDKLRKNFPNLNVFINNAGQAYADSQDFNSLASEEQMLSHYFAGIRLSEELIPVLRLQDSATIADLTAITYASAGNIGLKSGIRKTAESYGNVLAQSLKESRNIRILQASEFRNDGSVENIITALTGSYDPLHPYHRKALEAGFFNSGFNSFDMTFMAVG